MERDCHYSVGGIKGFLNAVTMVDIDVDVEDALVITKELEDAKNNICRLGLAWTQERGPISQPLTIYVTETARFALLCVMQTARPVHCYVAFPTIEPCCTFHTATSADTAELEQAIEDRTVVSNIKSPLFFLVQVHVIRRNFLEKFDVFISMELGHFEVGSGLRAL